MSVYSALYLLCLGVLYVNAVQAPLKELNDGNKMPVVALGTGVSNYIVFSIREVKQAVYSALEAGYRHIDTATIYQDEPEVGHAIKEAFKNGLVKREDLFITTKLWNHAHARDQVVPNLRESLQKLRLAYVDLYLIHYPVAFNEYGTPTDHDFLDTWKGMEDARELGLTKSIGVSNFNASQIDRLVANSKVKPAVNQIEVNPTLTQEQLVSHCQQLNITVMAYCPFGFMLSPKTGVEQPPPPRADDPALVTMAEKYGKSTAQIVLKYLVQRNLIPIPISRNKERIADYINIFDFELTNDEIDIISQFNKNMRVVNPVSWNSSIYYPFVEY